MRTTPVLLLAAVLAVACGKAASDKKNAPSDSPKEEQAVAKDCGNIDIDGTKIPLDCNEPGYGKIPGASVVPFRSYFRDDEPDAPDTEQFGKKKKKKLPKKVDHREDGTEGPIRDQGPVGACTAFSLATAIDHALLRVDDSIEPVSVMHIWGRYAMPSMSEAVRANRDEPISLEKKWPYDPDDACSWFSPSFCKKGCGKPSSYCGEEPSQKKLKKMNKAAVGHITKIVKLDLDDAKGFREAIAKGADIWFAIKVTPKFGLVRDEEVPDFDASGSMSAHAMVLAGYRKSDGEYEYLIHNSWGKKWGAKGWAWIKEDTLFRNLQYAYLVDAEPTDEENHAVVKQPKKGPPLFQHMGKNALATCPSGQVPDAATKACSKPCGDGAPPVNGSCNTCGDGDSNCLAAAPTQRGSDPKTNVSWTCGAGGCVYSIPKGQYGCTDTLCEVSCAAPKYLLSFGDAGVGCSE